MKFIIPIVILVCFAILTSYALGFRQRTGLCNVEFQDSLDTIATQSQTVLSDWKSACTRSYAVLTDWDICLIQAEGQSPEKLILWLRPVVSTFMLFFQEKEKDMDVMKRDHDERCKAYTELMFYPPENE